MSSLYIFLLLYKFWKLIQVDFSHFSCYIYIYIYKLVFVFFFTFLFMGLFQFYAYDRGVGKLIKFDLYFFCYFFQFHISIFIFIKNFASLFLWVCLQHGQSRSHDHNQEFWKLTQVDFIFLSLFYFYFQFHHSTFNFFFRISSMLLFFHFSFYMVISILCL
jgi:hypothetical protein